MYKAEVKNQLDSKIKIVRSDKGGKYYGRYDKSDHNSESFTRCLE